MQTQNVLGPLADPTKNMPSDHEVPPRSDEDTLRVDPLTGLLGNEGFFDQAREFTHVHPSPWCFVAIDICHFKLFNDWYGRDKGNALLVKFGSILNDFTRCGGCAGYLGNDDFALFIPHDPKRIQELFDRLKSAVMSFEGASSGFVPQFGIRVATCEAEVDHSQYDQALMALRDGAESYRGRIHYFDPGFLSRQEEEVLILGDFQTALERDEITFFVQPQCSQSTGRIVGAEALVRWKRPDGSFRSPADFIPALERTGFIVDLDMHVWERVCIWIRSLMDREIDPVPISVNVSRGDLFSLDIAEHFDRLVRKHGIPAHLLKIEITETACGEDFQMVNNLVERLHQKGFSVMMDDFGNGYSSLNMLGNTNVDVIKLDMGFLRRAPPDDRRALRIIESIVNMAKNIGMPIVVEGVETLEQVKFFDGLGCRYIQGYAFFRPMPTDQLEEILANPDKVDPRGIRVKRNEEFHVREFLNPEAFTDTMLNNILGPVAFYSFDGENLAISRFNQQFYRCVADVEMEERQVGIQNYVVPQDLPLLYGMLETAVNDPANGGTCTVRFQKSNGGTYWYSMHLFYLHEDAQGKQFFGKVDDLTERQQHDIGFFNMLRDKSDYCMRLNLSTHAVQHIGHTASIADLDVPSMDMEECLPRTALSRIPDEEGRRRFLDFFDPTRLSGSYRAGVYEEEMAVDFRGPDGPHPTVFSIFYAQCSLDQDLLAYVFGKIQE